MKSGFGRYAEPACNFYSIYSRASISVIAVLIIFSLIITALIIVIPVEKRSRADSIAKLGHAGIEVRSSEDQVSLPFARRLQLRCSDRLIRRSAPSMISSVMPG